MKKRLLLILLTMVSVMAARSEDRVILDWGRNVPWDMKYVFQEVDEGIAPNGKVSISNNQFTNKRLETVILPDVSGITTGIGYVDAIHLTIKHLPTASKASRPKHQNAVSIFATARRLL